MLKKALILFFIFVVLTPLPVWLLRGPSSPPGPGSPPMDFPSPYDGALLKTDYYRALDRYINEQFVFRDQLRRIKYWIDYKLFSRTDRPDVHVGRRGWLFRRVDIENHVQSRCEDPGAAHRLLLELHAVEKVVKASGRRFRLLVVPSKASVYPEYVGWVPLAAGGRCSAYDLLREAHYGHPLETWVPLEAAIMGNKFGSHLLYDATTGYWNGRGAAVAAEALHQSLFRANTLVPVLTIEERHDNLEQLLLGPAARPPKRTLRRLAGERTDGLGHGLVYGDGGIESLLPHLAQMARRVDVISSEMIPSRRSAEDWRPFDSILIQTTESGLRDLRLDIDRIYDQLIGEADPVTIAPVDPAAVRSIAHTALNPVGGGLEIKSVGARSSFALIDLPGSYRRCFRLLRLDLSALQPEKMTVEYRTNPPLRTVRPIPAGRFNLYLPLPVKSRVTMRFQPGEQAGLLVLHTAEIIGFSEGDADACGRRTPDRDVTTASADEVVRSVAAETAVAADRKGLAPPTGANPRPPDELKGTQGDGAREKTAGGMKPDGEMGANATAAVQPAEKATAVPQDSAAEDTPAAAAPSFEKVSSRKAPTEGGGPDARRPGSEAAVETRVAADTLASTPAVPTITLNDFMDGRIFQRQGRSADIIVSGAFTGAPGAIEARVVHRDHGARVVPWTVIDAAPRNGIFLGLLPRVPQGGWYFLEVRARDMPDVGDRGRHNWGVGILIACIGQSNMKEWFHTGTDLEAHSLLRLYSGQGWQPLGSQGNGAIACGNRIAARTGIPVGLLEYAVNGSGLHRKADWGTGFWEDTRSGSIYRRFVTHVAATGGRLECVIWVQGEADAARGTVTGGEYQAALTRFIERQVRQDIANGSDRPQLPFLVVEMVKRPGGRDDPHQALREAQWAVADQLAECYLAATTLDLKNQGKQHLAPEAYTVMGRRVAQTILYVLGLEGFYRGPRVASINVVGEQTLEAALQHEGGDDIRPASGITGWEVVDDLGMAPIRKVMRQDPRTIRIVLERSLVPPAEVRYLYGARPDTRRPLKDNATPSLPLEAFRGVVAP